MFHFVVGKYIIIAYWHSLILNNKLTQLISSVSLFPHFPFPGHAILLSVRFCGFPTPLLWHMPQSTRFVISQFPLLISPLPTSRTLVYLFDPLPVRPTSWFHHFPVPLLPVRKAAASPEKRIWADVVSCSRRRCFTKRNPEAQTTEVDKTYQELDLTKINTEDINYQSLRNRKLQRNSEPQTAVVDTTYNELDLSKMNTADDYQSLRVSAAIVNTYTV